MILKRSTFFLLTILLLAFALRIWNAGQLNMWGDEAFSVFSANRSLAAITIEGAENDPHPPLYYYLLHFYLPLAGASEFALRFFSVFFGVATIVLVYSIGARLFNPRVGLFAAFIAALAPFHVYYSQEIRMYSLAMSLAACGVYFFARLFQEACVIARTASGAKQDEVISVPVSSKEIASQKPLAMTERWHWLLYALSLFLALYALYHTAFVFLALGIFLLTRLKTHRDFFLRWLAISSATVVLFLPWLLFRFSATLGHLEDRAGSATPFNLPLFAARGFTALTVGATIPPATALTLALIPAAIIFIGIFIAIRSRNASWRDGLLITLVGVPILAVYVLYLAIPIFNARIFALAFVPLALLLARAVTLFPRRALAPLMLVVAAISAYSLNDYYFRFSRYNSNAEDYLPVIRAVEERAQAGDVVLFHAFWHEGYFLSHYNGARVEYRELQRDLDVAVAQPRNVWAIVQNFDGLPAEAFLARNAFFIDEQKFGTLRLLFYRAGAPGRVENFSQPILFDNGIALLGYRLNDAPIEAGHGAATIEMDWQATRKIAADFTVSIRLTVPRSQVIVAQVDQRLEDETNPTSTWTPQKVVKDRHGLAVPADAVPGDYALEIVLYNFQDSRVANIIAPENSRGGSLGLEGISIIPRARAAPK